MKLYGVAVYKEETEDSLVKKYLVVGADLVTGEFEIVDDFYYNAKAHELAYKLNQKENATL